MTIYLVQPIVAGWWPSRTGPAEPSSKFWYLLGVSPVFLAVKHLNFSHDSSVFRRFELLGDDSRTLAVPCSFHFQTRLDSFGIVFQLEHQTVSWFQSFICWTKMELFEFFFITHLSLQTAKQSNTIMEPPPCFIANSSVFVPSEHRTFLQKVSGLYWWTWRFSSAGQHHEGSLVSLLRRSSRTFLIRCCCFFLASKPVFFHFNGRFGSSSTFSHNFSSSV